MTPERWKQVNGVFCSALEREPGQRVVFLDEACAGDDELRKEVDSLIRYHEQTGSFIDSPAFDVAAQKLPEDQRELVEGRVLESLQDPFFAWRRWDGRSLPRAGRQASPQSGSQASVRLIHQR
jgi:hypothetical protein